MTTYSVNMSNVQEVVQELNAIGNQVGQMLEELEQSSQSSLATWTSAARDAYNTAMANWTAAAANMNVQAANASAALGNINDNYANAEYQGMGLWGQ